MIRWLFALLALTAQAAVTNVRVAGVSNTQAILKYTAPDTAACTVEVSESASYSPVVHDVNGTHYSGANLDSRTAAVTNGRERTVVIGKRTIERAGSYVAYSRALQAATLHYYRITCGADTATGTFTTASIAFGNTHGDAVIPDLDNPGWPMRITPQWPRNSTWIDPHTGALIKRMHQPQDNNLFTVYNDNLFTSVVESTNWTDPNNVLTVNSTSGTYDGASCGATCDWLKLSFTYVIDTSDEQHLDVLRISINGSGNDATAANRTVEICPISLGATSTTIDPNGACKELILPQTTAAKVTTSVSGLVDTWRAPGKTDLTLIQIAAATNIRFAVRKKNGTGTISVDAVRIDAWQSTTSNVGTGGSLDRCNQNLRADGRYLCTAHNANFAATMYSIHAETGDVRFLGSVYSTGNFQMSYDNWLWDGVDPNVWYGQGSGDTDQFKYTYTGDGSEVAAGTKVTLTRAAIRAGGEVLGPAVETFVAAHSAEYPGVPLFDTAKFNCGIKAVQLTYLLLECRGQQDTYTWIGVYDRTTETIIAAMPEFAAPSARWCVSHTWEPAGNVAISTNGTTHAKDNYAGNGIYKSTLVGALGTSNPATVTVTSTCGGDATCASHVAGEPVATLGDDYLMAAQVGDVFVIDSEYVRITTKNSPTEWVIARGLAGDGGSGVVSHSSGATFNAHCAMKPGTGPTAYISSFIHAWNFLADPYGMDATGTYVWGNKYVGHSMARGNLWVANKSVSQSAEGTYILETVKDPQFTLNVPEAPYFAGKIAPGDGNTWQQHPSTFQVGSPLNERLTFLDIRPFVGGNNVMPVTAGCDPTAAWPTCSAKRVSGLTNVYRVGATDGNANPDGINPKHFDLMGVAFINMLHDVSGPTSVLDDSAGKNYSMCYVVVAGECVAGSAAGQSYVQVPGATIFHCTGGEGFGGGNDICFSDYMSTGASLAQHGFAPPTKRGISTAQLANPFNMGAGNIRMVSLMGLSMGYRLMSIFSTGKPISNGKWILATDWMEAPTGARGLVSLVKNVPIVMDTKNRSTFQVVPIKISTVPTGTDNVVVKFGYMEYGNFLDFRCTSRAEACFSVASALNETTPFYWASESFSGLPCASGCTPVINALPGRVVWYQVFYRNASNVVLVSGPVEPTIVF